MDTQSVPNVTPTVEPTEAVASPEVPVVETEATATAEVSNYIASQGGREKSAELIASRLGIRTDNLDDAQLEYFHKEARKVRPSEKVSESQPQAPQLQQNNANVNNSNNTIANSNIVDNSELALYGLMVRLQNEHQNINVADVFREMDSFHIPYRVDGGVDMNIVKNYISMKSSQQQPVASPAPALPNPVPMTAQPQAQQTTEQTSQASIEAAKNIFKNI